MKTALYAIMGIVEYWVADLRNDRVLCYSDPSGDSYCTIREFHHDDSVSPLFLQGCPLNLAVLLPQ